MGEPSRREPPTDPASLPVDVAGLQDRLRDAEEALDSIRRGDVDSLVIGYGDNTQVYSLSTADRPYRLIVAGMAEGAATISSTGLVLYANAGLAEIVGRPVGELVGSSVLELSADRETLARALDVPDGRTARTRLDLRRDDGAITPVVVAVSGMDHGADTSVRCLIVTDLTTTLEAERELARTHAALRERDAFLEEAAQVVGLGTWEATSDVEGPLTWSENVYAIMGETRDSFDERARTHFNLVHPDDRLGVVEAFIDATTGRAPFRVRNRIVRPSGEVRWVEQAAVVEHSELGAPTRVLGIMQDITSEVLAADLARRQAEELERRVRLRTAELTAANQDLEAFTYSVSHDLRAPLRAINAFSQTLVEECSDQLDDNGRAYATRVQVNGAHMSQLLDALLRLSRVSRAPMRTRPVDLSGMVEAVTADLREREPDRAVRVTVQPGVAVVGDPDLLRSALQNLVDNAWKFTGKRAGATIEFGAKRTEDGTVEAYVRDNGAGFDQALADRLFQPFQRLHTMEDFPGTGMGLASVRRIIERHGGRVGVRSQVGAGTTVSFTLTAEG